MWFSKRDAGVVVDPAMGDPLASQLRAALMVADWPAVRAILESVTHPDDRAFYLDVCGTVPGVQTWIGSWVEAEPASTLAQLVRGCHAVEWAWQARGRLTIEHTRRDQVAAFFQRLQLADAYLLDVVRRDPEDLTAWTFLIRCARGLQVGIREQRFRFDQVNRRFPGHLEAHHQLMQGLCAKWSGNNQAMAGFARTAGETAAPGNLIGYLIPLSHLELFLELNGDVAYEYMETERVRADLRAAAERSIWHPDAEFRPGWPSRLNTFAMAFTLSQDREAAARVFDQLGDLYTEFPWGYLGGDSARKFATARAQAYAAIR